MALDPWTFGPPPFRYGLLQKKKWLQWNHQENTTSQWLWIIHDNHFSCRFLGFYGWCWKIFWARTSSSELIRVVISSAESKTTSNNQKLRTFPNSKGLQYNAEPPILYGRDIISQSCLVVMHPTIVPPQTNTPNPPPHYSLQRFTLRLVERRRHLTRVWIPAAKEPWPCLPPVPCNAESGRNPLAGHRVCASSSQGDCILCWRCLHYPKLLHDSLRTRHAAKLTVLVDLQQPLKTQSQGLMSGCSYHSHLWSWAWIRWDVLF